MIVRRSEAEVLVNKYFDNCHYMMFGDFDLSREDRRAKALEWYLDLAVAIGLVELDRPQDDDHPHNTSESNGIPGECRCSICVDLRPEVQHRPDEESFQAKVRPETQAELEEDLEAAGAERDLEEAMSFKAKVIPSQTHYLVKLYGCGHEDTSDNRFEGNPTEVIGRMHKCKVCDQWRSIQFVRSVHF